MVFLWFLLVSSCGSSCCLLGLLVAFWFLLWVGPFGSSWFLLVPLGPFASSLFPLGSSCLLPLGPDRVRARVCALVCVCARWVSLSRWACPPWVSLSHLPRVSVVGVCLLLSSSLFSAPSCGSFAVFCASWRRLARLLLFCLVPPGAVAGGRGRVAPRESEP